MSFCLPVVFLLDDWQFLLFATCILAGCLTELLLFATGVLAG